MVFKPTPKLERNVESVVEKIWQNDVKMEDSSLQVMDNR